MLSSMLLDLPSSIVKPQFLPFPILVSALPIPPQCGILAPCKCWSWACRSYPAPPSVAVDASSPWRSNHSPAAHRARPRQQETGRSGWRAGGWWSRPHSSRHGRGRPPGPLGRRGREEPPRRAMRSHLGVWWRWRWPWFLVWRRKKDRLLMPGTVFGARV